MAVVANAAEPADAYPGATLAFLSVAAACSVANLCYAQPLAEAIARDFGTTASGVSSALVGTQLGYAAGMLLLVPLNDILERRRTIVITAACAALALLGFAAAPSLALLTVASVLVGLGSSVAQMIVPFAVGLAAPEHRGRVVGNVMGGVLVGVLLSRTASGTLGTLIGWRMVFVAAAGLMAALAGILAMTLPAIQPTTALSYRALLGSLAGIVRREKILRERCVVGAVGFASFSTFWSTIAFHLAHGPIGGGSATAGLLGALGVFGIFVGPLASRLAMRIPPERINLGALVVVAASFAVFAAAPDSLVAICVGVVLIDVGTRASQLTNQTVIYGLGSAERNRINAIYMVAYFLGGALGTGLAAQALQLGGWSAVCATGGALAVLAMLPLRRR
jgi:predicted MFS family arabinose efflux permease